MALIAFFEEYEHRLWPTETLHAKTRFRILCRVEMLIKIVFSWFLLEDNVSNDD